MSIWLAETDTEHFTWHAFGTSADDAKDRMVKGFNRHLVECAKRDKVEPEYWSLDRFDNYYGIRTLEVQPGKTFIDGDPV